MTARNSIIPVFVPHLGCPNDCVFCNQRRISGEKEAATAQTVKAAIESAAALTKGESKRQLAFYGGSFTAIPVRQQEELLSAAAPYLENGTISSIRLSTRPDAIDETVLKRLSNHGVSTIELGAQSMCDEVLMLSGRGHTAKAVEEASRLIKESGFELVLQMMTGLPGDSEERSVETARRMIALHPNFVRIYPTVIVRDTALFDLWQTGHYTEHTVEDAVNVCAKIVPMFEAAGIGIIRLGLNPTDELSGGAAVGGAYHPALGELVYSRIMRNLAADLLKDKQGTSVTLGVNPSDISKATGQHRCNIEWLRREYSLKELKIKACDIEKNKIVLLKMY